MIEINDLTFRYSGGLQPVFSDFSMQLPEGRIYGLLGKNGTGKSTLLYLLAGLHRPKGGSVKVDGMEAFLRQPEMLGEIFLVPEEFDLPSLPLADYLNINKPFYPRFSEDVLNRCLEAFELPRDLHLGRLSMGQKKKVFMSVALAAGTKFLLMDEPTNGMDIPSKSQFRKVVAEGMSEGRTIIISTHQVHDVEQLLDHILILSVRQLLLNMSISDITSRFCFEVRQPQQMDQTVIYAEPSIMGNFVVSHRTEGRPETLVSLELLFNAVNQGLIK